MQCDLEEIHKYQEEFTFKWPLTVSQQKVDILIDGSFNYICNTFTVNLL